MKKAILAWMILSLGVAFTACRSDGNQTTEERLRSIYGWKGESLPLPPPAPNPEDTESVLPQEQQTPDSSKEKDAGIVSTIDPSETALTAKEQTDAAKAPEDSSVKKDDSSVKDPSIAENESGKTEKTDSLLSGETRIHVVKQGESLWSIAAGEYGSGYRWGIISHANKELLKGKPDSIRPGMKLVIPLLKQKTAPAQEKKPAELPPIPAAPAAPVAVPAPAKPAASAAPAANPTAAPAPAPAAPANVTAPAANPAAPAKVAAPANHPAAPAGTPAAPAPATK